MKKYSIARMNYIGEVGKFVSNPDAVNPNTGMPLKNKWKKERTVYFGNYRLTTQEQISLAGTLTTDIKIIAVRNEYQLQPNELLKVPSHSFGYYCDRYEEPQYYLVKKVSRDSSINGIDLAVLEKKTGYK